MAPAVFISYSHKDADFARQLVADIQPRVRSVWFDESSIRPGRYWDDEIEKGIRESDVLLSLLSPNLLDSKICKDEFDNADRLGKPIIPVLVAQCPNDKMWMRMARRQWIDFRADYGGGLSRLFFGLANLGEYAIPLQQKCLICGFEGVSTKAGACPNCKLPYIPQHLGEVYELTAEYLQKYLLHYQPRVLIPNAGVDDLLAVAIVQLIMRSYDTTIALLERLLTMKPSHAYAWYLKGIAQLKGKRPRVMTRTEAASVALSLENAVSNDLMLSQSYALLALVKSDYFESKGFRIDGLQVQESIHRASRGIKNKNEFLALTNLASLEDCQLFPIVRAIFQ